MRKDFDDDKMEELGLKARVVKALGDIGIRPGMVVVEVLKNGLVRVRGEVSAEQTHESIRGVVMDIAGEGHIVDEVLVLHGMEEDPLDDYLYDDGALYGEKEEYIGTEDAYRSLEDGIPYIPPTESSYRIYEDRNKSKRKRDRG